MKYEGFDEIWMNSLFEHIFSLNLENVEEYIEKYNDWEYWKHYSENGFTPQEAFNNEMEKNNK